VADDVRTLDPAPEPPGLDAEADAASRRRARWWVWALVAVVVVAVVGVLAVSRQSSTSDVPPAPEAFCRAANAYEEELERQAAAYEKDTARQIAKVADIAATAPRSVRADAEYFLAQLERVQAAPSREARERIQEQLEDDPTVRARIDNVTRRWNQGCGVFDRESGL
jgi:hypothetical protein